MIRGTPVFLLLSIASAQATIVQEIIPQRGNCLSKVHHQLDFWIGDWTVYAQGSTTPLATSHVESVMDGCALRETYNAPTAPARPYAGTSLSTYDRKDGKWHQLYIDTGGNLVLYTGTFDGAGLALQAPGENGALQTMTLIPQADGTLHQSGTYSLDGGKTWTADYDYIYRRK